MLTTLMYCVMVAWFGIRVQTNEGVLTLKVEDTSNEVNTNSKDENEADITKGKNWKHLRRVLLETKAEDHVSTLLPTNHNYTKWKEPETSFTQTEIYPNVTADKTSPETHTEKSSTQVEKLTSSMSNIFGSTSTESKPSTPEQIKMTPPVSANVTLSATTKRMPVGTSSTITPPITSVGYTSRRTFTEITSEVTSLQQTQFESTNLVSITERNKEGIIQTDTLEASKSSYISSSNSPAKTTKTHFTETSTTQTILTNSDVISHTTSPAETHKEESSPQVDQIESSIPTTFRSTSTELTTDPKYIVKRSSSEQAQLTSPFTGMTRRVTLEATTKIIPVEISSILAPPRTSVEDNSSRNVTEITLNATSLHKNKQASAQINTFEFTNIVSTTETNLKDNEQSTASEGAKSSHTYSANITLRQTTEKISTGTSTTQRTPTHSDVTSDNTSPTETNKETNSPQVDKLTSTIFHTFRSTASKKTTSEQAKLTSLITLIATSKTIPVETSSIPTRLTSSVEDKSSRTFTEIISAATSQENTFQSTNVVSTKEQTQNATLQTTTPVGGISSHMSSSRITLPTATEPISTKTTTTETIPTTPNVAPANTPPSETNKKTSSVLVGNLISSIANTNVPTSTESKQSTSVETKLTSPSHTVVTHTSTSKLPTKSIPEATSLHEITQTSSQQNVFESANISPTVKTSSDPSSLVITLQTTTETISTETIPTPSVTIANTSSYGTNANVSFVLIGKLTSSISSTFGSTRTEPTTNPNHTMSQQTKMTSRSMADENLEQTMRTAKSERAQSLHSSSTNIIVPTTEITSTETTTHQNTHKNAAVTSDSTYTPETHKETSTPQVGKLTSSISSTVRSNSTKSTKESKETTSEQDKLTPHSTTMITREATTETTPTVTSSSLTLPAILVEHTSRRSFIEISSEATSLPENTQTSLRQNTNDLMNVLSTTEQNQEGNMHTTTSEEIKSSHVSSSKITLPTTTETLSTETTATQTIFTRSSVTSDNTFLPQTHKETSLEVEIRTSSISNKIRSASTEAASESKYITSEQAKLTSPSTTMSTFAPITEAIPVGRSSILTPSTNLVEYTSSRMFTEITSGASSLYENTQISSQQNTFKSTDVLKTENTEAGTVQTVIPAGTKPKHRSSSRITLPTTTDAISTDTTTTQTIPTNSDDTSANTSPETNTVISSEHVRTTFGSTRTESTDSKHTMSQQNKMSPSPTMVSYVASTDTMTSGTIPSQKHPTKSADYTSEPTTELTSVITSLHENTQTSSQQTIFESTNVLSTTQHNQEGTLQTATPDGTKSSHQSTSMFSPPTTTETHSTEITTSQTITSDTYTKTFPSTTHKETSSLQREKLTSEISNTFGYTNTESKRTMSEQTNATSLPPTMVNRAATTELMSTEIMSNHTPSTTSPDYATSKPSTELTSQTTSLHDNIETYTEQTIFKSTSIGSTIEENLKGTLQTGTLEGAKSSHSSSSMITLPTTETVPNESTTTPIIPTSSDYSSVNTFHTETHKATSFLQVEKLTSPILNIFRSTTIESSIESKETHLKQTKLTLNSTVSTAESKHNASQQTQMTSPSPIMVSPAATPQSMSNGITTSHTPPTTHVDHSTNKPPTELTSIDTSLTESTHSSSRQNTFVSTNIVPITDRNKAGVMQTATTQGTKSPHSSRSRNTLSTVTETISIKNTTTHTIPTSLDDTSASTSTVTNTDISSVQFRKPTSSISNIFQSTNTESTTESKRILSERTNVTSQSPTMVSHAATTDPISSEISYNHTQSTTYIDHTTREPPTELTSENTSLHENMQTSSEQTIIKDTHILSTIKENFEDTLQTGTLEGATPSHSLSSGTTSTTIETIFNETTAIQIIPTRSDYPSMNTVDTETHKKTSLISNKFRSMTTESLNESKETSSEDNKLTLSNSTISTRAATTETMPIPATSSVKYTSNQTSTEITSKAMSLHKNPQTSLQQNTFESTKSVSTTEGNQTYSTLGASSERIKSSHPTSTTITSPSTTGTISAEITISQTIPIRSTSIESTTESKQVMSKQSKISSPFSTVVSHASTTESSSSQTPPTTSTDYTTSTSPTELTSRDYSVHENTQTSTQQTIFESTNIASSTEETVQVTVQTAKSSYISSLKITLPTMTETPPSTEIPIIRTIHTTSDVTSDNGDAEKLTSSISNTFISIRTESTTESKDTSEQTKVIPPSTTMLTLAATTKLMSDRTSSILTPPSTSLEYTSSRIDMTPDTTISYADTQLSSQSTMFESANVVSTTEQNQVITMQTATQDDIKLPHHSSSMVTLPTSKTISFTEPPTTRTLPTSVDNTSAERSLSTTNTEMSSVQVEKLTISISNTFESTSTESTIESKEITSDKTQQSSKSTTIETLLDSTETISSVASSSQTPLNHSVDYSTSRFLTEITSKKTSEQNTQTSSQTNTFEATTQAGSISTSVSEGFKASSASTPSNNTLTSTSVTVSMESSSSHVIPTSSSRSSSVGIQPVSETNSVDMSTGPSSIIDTSVPSNMISTTELKETNTIKTDTPQTTLPKISLAETAESSTSYISSASAKHSTETAKSSTNYPSSASAKHSTETTAKSSTSSNSAVTEITPPISSIQEKKHPPSMRTLPYTLVASNLTSLLLLSSLSTRKPTTFNHNISWTVISVDTFVNATHPTQIPLDHHSIDSCSDKTYYIGLGAGATLVGVAAVMGIIWWARLIARGRTLKYSTNAVYPEFDVHDHVAAVKFQRTKLL